MTTPRPTPPPSAPGAIERLGLNPLLQTFLTIIAGTAVAVIAWTVVQRFLHIIVLLAAGFLVAYLLGPLVQHIERSGLRRTLAILAVYAALFGLITLIALLFAGPLTAQLQALVVRLPELVSGKPGATTQLDRLLTQHGLGLTVAGIRAQVGQYVASAGTTLLGNTITVLTSVASTVTDLLLVLAIAFYLLLDGHTIHNRAVRLLPRGYRDRWFFFEALVNTVLGAYIRGQLVVATTVGVAAGVGCSVLGVHYSVVIGLLAFLAELIPMIGPVLGMLPAVLIALFQPLPMVIWVIAYFIVLQQIESNAIVPRVSGHAVGLHPLAALLALLVGLELGGLGGALIAVPLTGMLWVVLIALYGDATGQTTMIASAPPTRPALYVSLARNVLDRRRVRATGGSSEVPVAASGEIDTPVAVNSERLQAIKQEQEHLIERFEADEGGKQESEAALTPSQVTSPP